jgi:hypothetical protein
MNGQESPSVVLRLAPWRARAVARVLQEWSAVSRIFHHPTRPHLDELDLSRTLELAAAVLGGGDEPIVRSPRGSRVIPHCQRLAAVAVLGEREAHLSAVQRLALVDAAAWWLSEPNGGEKLPTRYPSITNRDGVSARETGAKMSTHEPGWSSFDVHRASSNAPVLDNLTEISPQSLRQAVRYSGGR